MAGSKFFSVMVVGDDPVKLMEKYDRSLKVKPYIKFKYLDAEKLQNNAIKVFDELVKNREKLSLNSAQADYFKEKVHSIKAMSSFEYYKTITDGLYYDENGNALSDENPNGIWTKYHIGQNFSYPLIRTDGSTKYQCKAKDVDWNANHMEKNLVRLYEALWELVVEGRKPENDDEERTFNEWKGRTHYFEKFKDKDQFIAHNTSFWHYAYLDENGWHDVNEAKNDMEWVATFFERFVTKLKDDDIITIYEYSVLDE